jgi:hypothetical protein
MTAIAEQWSGKVRKERNKLKALSKELQLGTESGDEDQSVGHISLANM